MNYEQKYKEALKVIESLYSVVKHQSSSDALLASQTIEKAFPELKERDDERIRKATISFLEYYEMLEEADHNSTEGIKECISWLGKQSHDGKKWIYEDVYYKEKEQLYQDGVDDVLENPQKYGLEKQGEQKTTDKVESKFKVGDWITNGKLLVGQVTSFDGEYYHYMQEGIEQPLHISNAYNWHLWTIQDAKDGDILNSVRVKATIIFKNFNSDGKHINAYCALQQGFLIKQELPWDRDFEPATKEWRELLFQKMKEEGYELDAKKKELKKIEQKHTWSEEDEIGLGDALWAIEQAKTISKDENDMGNLWFAENWLKSLKPNHWKPSELISEECQRNIEGKDTVYIRKDVLLEWAKNMKHICKGAEMVEKVYQTIIDKIESL